MVYIYSHDIIRSNGRRALHNGNSTVVYVRQEEVENRQEVHPRTIQYNLYLQYHTAGRGFPNATARPI